MFKVRVIPCLDVKDGRVVKGVNFVDLRDAGDLAARAKVLAAEAEAALRAPLADLAPHWTLERRTGDTSSTDRARRRGPATRSPHTVRTTVAATAAASVLPRVGHGRIDWHGGDVMEARPTTMNRLTPRGQKLN